MRRLIQTPHICCESCYLVGSEFRAAHGRHRAAILLWLRHTFRYRFYDSGKAAIAPQPFFTGQIGTQRRPCGIRTMASGTSGSAHLAVVNAIAQATISGVAPSGSGAPPSGVCPQAASLGLATTRRLEPSH